jgi:hypothetical protein
VTAPVKPPAVENHYEYWGTKPPAPSARCTYWVERIQNGWLPNRRIGSMGYDMSAQWYGCWLWEYLNVLYPLIVEKRMLKTQAAATAH